MTDSQAFIEERTYRVDSFKDTFSMAMQVAKLALPGLTYAWSPKNSGVTLVSQGPTHRFEFVLDFACLELRQSHTETVRATEFVAENGVRVGAGSILGAADRASAVLNGVIMRAGYLVRDYGASTVQRALIDAANEVHTKFPSWDACPYT